MGREDKAVIKILQLCFPHPFPLPPHLVGTVQCCSVHRQSVLVSYLLHTQGLSSTCQQLRIISYHSFKICPCVQSSRQALLSHMSLFIELPCAMEDMVNGGKEDLLAEDARGQNTGQSPFVESVKSACLCLPAS